MPGIAPPKGKTPPGSPGAGMGFPPGVVGPMGPIAPGKQVGGNAGGTGSQVGSPDPMLAAIWAMMKKIGATPPTVVNVPIGGRK